VNVFFEAVYSPRARWVLERLPIAEVVALDRCIGLLERNPYPDAAHIGTLSIPGEPPYHNAYRCGDWGIAYHIEDNVFLSIDVIGRWWPPQPWGTS
jgi:hypothetical protein